MVSVIILAYNRCKEVLITIGQMEKLKVDLPFQIEIIVVDNASIDDTSDQITAKFPGVKLITRKINVGVSGWNDGFAVAKFPYLLVLDDDSHIINGLPEAVLFMEDRLDVGILAFNIVDQQLQGDPNLAPDDAWKHMQEIPGFIGCGALIRHKVFEKIGGFASWLYVYTHEFEYGIRCWNAGFKILFFETATVVHRVSSINRTVKRIRTFGVRNELGIVYKFFPKSRWRYILKVFINNLKVVKKEGFRSAGYILMGFLKFVKMRKHLTYTPVTKPVQDFFAANFWSTQPVLSKNRKKNRNTDAVSTSISS